MDGMTLDRMQVVIEAQTHTYREAMKQITRQTQAMTKDVTAQTTKVKSLFSGLGKSILGLGIGMAAYKIGKDAIGIASSLTEVQNVVDVSFGKMAYKMEAFAKNSINTYGLSELTAKKTASIFAAMGKGIGLPLEMAADMSLSLTALSADMSSFFNTSQSEADTALKAIYTGETESIKRYGIAMTEVNMQEYAEQQGIYKSIEAMTQKEKVMLRYQYVTNQLSMVNGDFAKTSDSWANQTRILSERFKQLLGILGSGLMQVFLPVLQMINKVMSSLVAFAQTFSNVINSLFGKKTGEKSPITQAQEQANNAVGGAIGLQCDYNDELDKTTGKAKKATKEIANVFSFDQITKLNTSATNGSESNDGGAGNMGAINPIDFGWGQEQDISGIEATVEKVKNILATVFDPIQKSWNKYGIPTVTSFKNGFENLIYVGKDVFRVIGTHWKTMIEPITDLVFSITESCVLAFEVITVILKSAWDNGGAYLLGKIMDFVGAVANLATKINDNFIKPLIRWFNENLAPIVGDAIGFILSRIGDVLSVVSNFMNFLSSNESALTSFITIVGTLVVSWKTAQLLAYIDAGGGLVSTLKDQAKHMNILNTTHLKKYIDNIKVTVKMANEQLKSWLKVIPQIYNETKAWIAETIAKKDSGKVDMVKTFKNIGDAIGKAAKKIIDWVKQLLFGKAAQQAVDTANKVQTTSTMALTAAQVGATSATGALSTAMSFLAANPVIAILGAIALVVGGLALWTSSQSDTSNEIDKTTEKAVKQAEAIGELQQSMADNLAGSTVDVDNVRVYVEELEGLIDSEGKVIGNKDRVLFLISEINKAMPESVYWTEQGTVAYKDGADALAKNIALKEAQLKLEAIEPSYKEAIMKKQSALNDMVRVEGEYMKTNTELLALKSKGVESFTQEDWNNYSKLLRKVSELDNARKTTTDNYQNLSRITSQYSNLSTAIQTGDMAKIASASNALTVKFDENGKAQTSTLERDVHEMQVTYDGMLAARQAGNTEYSEELIKQQALELSVKKNSMYEGYVADCENKDEMLALLKEHDGKISYEQVQQFASELKNHEQAGGDNARIYLDNLKRDLANGDVTNEGYGLVSKLANVFKNNPININVGLSLATNLKKFGNSIVDSLRQSVNGQGRSVFSGMLAGTQAISPRNLNLPMMAKGGLADGPMAAIIGEAGKEAVIPLENNTGAIDLITAKMLSSLQRTGGLGSSGDIYLTITMESGEVVTRQVIKDYNKLMIANGGKGGFIF